MKKSGQPPFLAGRNYRRRRLVDAARLLPFLGLFLFLLPILWHPQTTTAPDTASGGEYLFSIWLMLIVAAFIIVRLLRVTNRTNDEEEDAG